MADLILPFLHQYNIHYIGIIDDNSLYICVIWSFNLCENSSMKKNRLLLHLDDNHRILTSSYDHGVFHECTEMTVRWPDSQSHLTYNLMVALCPFFKKNFCTLSLHPTSY